MRERGGPARPAHIGEERLYAPYVFVPINRSVFLPDWSSQANHEVPFSDGVCGRFWISITAHTPLFVGGGDPEDKWAARKERDKTQKPAPRKRFEIGGKPAIPGSTLRGLVSNVVAIASFGKMGVRVDDRRLSMRDLQNAKEYTSHFTLIAAGLRPKSLAGWLTVDPASGDWWLEPCDWSLVRQTDLEAHHKKTGTIDLGKRQSARQKYEQWRLPLDIAFTPGPWTTEGTFAKGRFLSRAIELGNGQTPGAVVFTGQPAERRNATPKRPAKKADFIFHTFTGERLAVPSGVREAFEWAHRDPVNGTPNDEWAFWKPRLNRGQRIPVFWLEAAKGSGERIRAIGLAQLFRLPCPTTTRMALANAAQDHLKDAPDLAETIFGYAGDCPGGGLKGRLRFGPALQTALGDVADEHEVELCLLGPKPGFYPAYLAQPDREPGNGPARVRAHSYFDGEKDRPYADYSTYMDPAAVLRGWKRYPVASQTRSAPTHTVNVTSIIRPVGRGVRFVAAVNVHNLRRFELGAVVWALTFGGQPGLRHALGLGKPYGYGSVEIGLTVNGPDGKETAELVPNDGAAVFKGRDAIEYLLSGRDHFALGMTETVLPRLGINTPWLETPQLRSLLATADPTFGDMAAKEGNLGYMPAPKLFQRVKSKDVRLVLPSWPPNIDEGPATLTTEKKAPTQVAAPATQPPRRPYYFGQAVRILRQEDKTVVIAYDDDPSEEETVPVQDLAWK